MEGYRIVAGLYLLGIFQALSFFTEGNIQDNYIGCYYDDVNDQPWLQQITLQNNATLTIELCIGQCLLQSSTYARLENSKECLCGNNFGVMLPDTSCNSLCPGNQSEYCGGSNGQRAYHSLYAVCEIGYYGYMCDQVCHCRRQAPCDRMTGKCPNECEEKWFGSTCSDTSLPEKYIGCFRENPEQRAISSEYYGSDHMTVEMCSISCFLRNNSIVGLQATRFCFCGENYAKYGPINEIDCSDRCPGNPSQKCGGALANSVYSVCPTGYYGPKCHNQCHCYNNSRCVYLTGECNSTCKAGWTGNSCNVRDCMIDGGGCSRNETCATVNLNFATITRCHCLPGFQRNAFWDICRDVDECALKSHDCSDATEECQNAIGSFFCICKKEFHRKNNICKDSDECALKIHNCSGAAEECSNTIGSFLCICKKGFERKNDSCEDVDECQFGLCDDSTTFCNNTNGSFKCYCKPGFKPNSETSCSVVPLGVAVGAAVGSVLGSAFLVVIVVIGILMWRRRRQRQKNSQDSSESRHRAQPDEKLEKPVSNLTYETLKKRQTQDESIYTELTSTEVASESQKTGEGFETGRYN